MSVKFFDSDHKEISKAEFVAPFKARKNMKKEETVLDRILFIVNGDDPTAAWREGSLDGFDWRSQVERALYDESGRYVRGFVMNDGYEVYKNDDGEILQGYPEN